MIVAFNVRVDKKIMLTSERNKLKISEHNIIYNLLDDVKAAMSDQLPIEYNVDVLGEADILQVFDINVKGKILEKIAGCRIVNGKVHRSAKVRILRQGESIWEGKFL